MNPQPHPWASTPEAADAARKAIQIPMALLPNLAGKVDPRELETKALAILTECALPPRDQAPTGCAKCAGSLEGRNSRFCSRECRHEYGKTVPGSHVGSMHEWPESDRAKYAVRTVGYALNNWLRTNHTAQ